MNPEIKPSVESEKTTSDNPYKLPSKPPLPKGVDVAVDCEPIASQYEEHLESLLARGWCGQQKSDGSIQIDQEIIGLLDYSQQPSHWRKHSKDLKCLFILLSNGERGFGYVHIDGRGRFAPYPHDNGCQPFGNGVFVDYESGFVVYRDEKFNPVQRTNYVLADRFYKHLSKVCRVKPKREYGAHGEHFKWIGGQCGYIGTDFRIVEPVIHSYEETPRPKGGKYDGDEPTGIEARMVETLQASLADRGSLEAVFLKGGCNFQSRYTRNPAECDEKYSGLPEELYKRGNSIREIHLRLEDQSYYRGLLVYNGAGGFAEWEREIYWHSVAPMEVQISD